MSLENDLRQYAKKGEGLLQTKALTIRKKVDKKREELRKIE